MPELFVGVDIGLRSSGLAVIDHTGALRVPLLEYCSTSEVEHKILALSANESTKTGLLVAVDAPLTLPAVGNTRGCETKLRKAGIRIYPAGASFFKSVSLAGIQLKEKLQAEGIEVIEIYPYASKFRLGLLPNSVVKPNKKSLAGRSFLQSGLKRLIPNIPSVPILSSDVLDAIVAAYTAFLYYAGKAERVEGDGEIIVPKAHNLPLPTLS